MPRHRPASPHIALLAVALTPIVAGGFACIYGGGRSYTVFDVGGQKCSPLQGVSRNWYRLGEEGAKPQRAGDGREYYISCFYYKAKKGTSLTISVQSSAFEPEIYLTRRGDEGILARDEGSETARISVTIPRNGDYGVVVTSQRPLGTGRFDVRYATSR